jgi:hypothetical protein
MLCTLLLILLYLHYLARISAVMHSAMYSVIYSLMYSRFDIFIYYVLSLCAARCTSYIKFLVFCLYTSLVSDRSNCYRLKLLLLGVVSVAVAQCVLRSQ